MHYLLTPEQALKQRGIRPTAVRLLILKQMRTVDCAQSQTDIELLLETVDRSTVSRTLSLFVERHLAHSFNGADGRLMYALCPEGCHCHDADDPHSEDRHAHFVCTVCHRTFCLRNMPLPDPQVPDGFNVASASYLLTGICPDCRYKKQKNQAKRTTLKIKTGC